MDSEIYALAIEKFVDVIYDRMESIVVRGKGLSENNIMEMIALFDKYEKMKRDYQWQLDFEKKYENKEEENAETE